jgi:CheY-like chemotaxis protein
MEIPSNRKILVVDDDPSVLTFVTTVAVSLDCEVLQAKDGVEALAAYGSEPGIGALVSDVRMPGINGFQLAHAIRQTNPGIPILLISGYADASEIPRSLKAWEGIRFLPKPFTPQQLGAELLIMFASGPDP